MKVLSGGKFPVKMWTDGVPVEPNAETQLLQVANLPFIYRHVAAMPDVHVGAGSTVGCVIPMERAICPAAVGVDIGCGMIAARSNIFFDTIMPYRVALREAIQNAIPMGRTDNGGARDVGSWGKHIPEDISIEWHEKLRADYEQILSHNPGASAFNTANHLGTLGTGNHFIELSSDEECRLWIVLHSGSRGPGNKIGTYFTNLAKERCRMWYVELPHEDLAYFPIGTDEFVQYMAAVKWAQQFAYLNRQIMLARVKQVLDRLLCNEELTWEREINCHHNYVAWEKHFGRNIMVTRKGAVRAQVGDLGFIPGSMGTRSYVVEGLGNRESFNSCSHGAGRVMSRTAARNTFTIQDHIRDTDGVECDKTEGVLDETPKAYKDIDAVMAAQVDLVKPIHTLKQVVCCKGLSDSRRK